MVLFQWSFLSLLRYAFRKKNTFFDFELFQLKIDLEIIIERLFCTLLLKIASKQYIKL